MKRVNGIYEKIASTDNLLAAFLKARRGKTRRADVLAFTARLDEELAALRDNLLAERFGFNQYHSFRVFDPKERLIHAAPFRDRVVHHAILNICEPHFERVQVFDSYACRKGKGTRAAIFRALQNCHRHRCFLKLDVNKYFHSICHDRLKGQLARLFKDGALLALLGAIVDGGAIQQRRGLPIGNLTSQYFANHYLASLDHFIQRTLRAGAYVRYMDDFVIWGNSTRELMRWERQMRRFAADQLSLELKPPCVNRSVAGLPFLEFLVRPGDLRLTSRSCRRIRRKWRACEKALEQGDIDQQQAAVSIRSLFARTEWAGGSRVRRSIMADDFGRRSRTATVSSVAVAGLTTPATVAVRTATGGNPAIATTTAASGSCCLPAQENGRMSSIEPGDDPVPAVNEPQRDEVSDGCRALVGRVDAHAERPRQLLLFPVDQDRATVE